MPNPHGHDTIPACPKDKSNVVPLHDVDILSRGARTPRTQPSDLGMAARRGEALCFGRTGNRHQPRPRCKAPATNNQITSSWLRTDQPDRIWWSQTGSNRRPHACKARALPTELWPRPAKDRALSGTTLNRPTRRIPNATWAPDHQRNAQTTPALESPRCRRWWTWEEMVGLGRLELPTSRLSSARSNQLSYKPESATSLDPATSLQNRCERRTRNPVELVRREKEETKAAWSRIMGPTKDPCSKTPR